MARLTPEQRLEKAKAAKARAEAEIRSAAAKLRSQDRRKDTRRKILLGGMLMSQARSRPDLARWVQARIAEMPERDRAAFDGWSPTPEAAPDRPLGQSAPSVPVRS